MILSQKQALACLIILAIENNLVSQASGPEQYLETVLSVTSEGWETDCYWDQLAEARDAAEH